MNRTLVVVGMIGMLIFTSGCDRQSTPCDPIGKVETDSKGQVWSCVKNQTTGKGYWYKGKY